jgi:uncharacterized protein YjdB
LGIAAVYIYGPHDNKERDENGGEYEYKGLYKPPPTSPGLPLRFNESGIAWRTMSRNQHDKKYDRAATASLALPAGVDGGVFTSAGNDPVYVLWAKTNKDRDESAQTTYSFPASLKVNQMAVTAWDETETTVSGNTVQLTGTPSLIRLNAAASPVVHVSAVNIEPSSLQLYLGETAKLTVKISPADAKNKQVSWSSENSAIASIDNTGEVKTRAIGNTVIKAVAADGNITATCPVEVRAVPIGLSYILIEPSWCGLKPGESTKINVTFYPEETSNKKLVWTSANTNIATVTQEGVVTAKSKGETYVTATPDDGGKEKAKSCTVRVE